MGVIQKETFKGSTWSYIGAVLGFVNTGLLFPKIFSTSEIGLLSILIAISALFSQFSSLGMNNVTNRLFPYFRNSKESHNGFLSLLLTVTLVGFVISLFVGLIFKDWIIESKNDDTGLLTKYAYYLIPLTFFTLYFTVFDTYNKMLYNISQGIFLKEFLLRILNFISIILFYFHLINFELFVLLYVVSYLIPTIGLAIILLIRKEFSLRWNKQKLSSEMKREIFFVALFGILAGFSGIAITYIDKYLIGKYLGLSDTGIYTIAFYIGTMILLPSRALNKISSTLIAECWKENDLEMIKNIYIKSSINQFLFGLLLFVLILVNLQNIFDFLPPQYAGGQWVMIVIGISNLVIMISGVSFSIINTSKYYWYMSLLMLTQIILIIFTNILLIPTLGIIGASIASLISVSIIRLGSMVIVGIKNSIWPLQIKHFTVLIISILAFFAGNVIPYVCNLYFDTIVRSIIVGVVFLSLTLTFKVSEEISSIFIKTANRFKNKINRV